MKRLLSFFTALALTLSGQETTAPAPEETIPEMEQPPNAAAASTKTASEWRNWVFAGSAAVVFTTAVLIVTLNTGSSQSNH